MALSLDDKLLGEKVHYYCSSSEGEDNDDNVSADESEDVSFYGQGKSVRDGMPESQAEMNGITTNVSCGLSLPPENYKNNLRKLLYT